MTRIHFLVATAAALFSLAAEAADVPPPKLMASHRAVFCGHAGHEEVTAAYGTAVNGEVGWRISAGARTAAEALGQMRAEYCGGHVAAVKK